jgi:anaerobic selenocysteine-containing dehydrogenase
MKAVSSFAAEHTVATVCPLDCPDSCSLDVTIQDGRIAAIDGSDLNPITAGTSAPRSDVFRNGSTDRTGCSTRRCGKGPKGFGGFERVSWDEALNVIAQKLTEVRDTWGGEAILPYSYGGSNGLLTQDTSDATLFRRLGVVAPGADRLRGGRPAQPTWRSTGRCRRSSTTIFPRRGSSSCGV